jgi:hypothetical protein
MPTGPSRPRRPDRWDAVLVGYALVAALCRPLTAAAAVAVLVPGVVLAAVAVARTPRPAAVPRSAAVPWVVLLGAAGVWELVLFVWGNDAERPTLSLLLDPVLDTYPGRLVGYLGWLAAGRWLVAR